MPHSQDELVEAVLRDDLGAVEAFLRADSERAARVVSQSICDWPLVSRAPSLPMAQKLVEFGADPRSVGPIWSSGLSVNPQVDRAVGAYLIEQGRLQKVDRVNLRAGEQVRLDDGTLVRFDGATPFVNLQVSHDPGQLWVLFFAMTMMAGLLVSLVVRRRRIWVRVAPAAGGTGTVNVEMGGLARTDNSGWGDEFERLTQRLLAPAGEEKRR